MQNYQSTIKKLRNKIDNIDKQIIALLKKRSYIIPKVKLYKNKHLPYKIAIKRELQIAKKIANADFGLYNNIYMQYLWRIIISATLNIETELKIAILKSSALVSSMEQVIKESFLLILK